MKIGERRTIVGPDALEVPACPLPRPGDIVVWYQNSVLRRGILVGHTCEGRPCIQPDSGVPTWEVSFDQIRLAEPDSAVGPIWHVLPATGSITQPTDPERRNLEQLASSLVPPGFRHFELMDEIWRRGFEVFLAGVPVRNALAGNSGRYAEIVTTMPLDRLHRTVIDMYGEDRVSMGELGRPWGRLRVGGLPDSTDPYAEIRLFRNDRPGQADAVFGASLIRDVAYGDFACNALFYDPINGVLIDPTGHGLDDAAMHRLRPVYDGAIRSPQEMARMGLLLIRQLLDGYELVDEYHVQLTGLVARLPALPMAERAARLKAEVLDDLRADEAKTIQSIYEVFVRLRMESDWNEHVLPCLELLE